MSNVFNITHENADEMMDKLTRILNNVNNVIDQEKFLKVTYALGAFNTFNMLARIEYEATRSKMYETLTEEISKAMGWSDE